jgi:3-methyl-2-oxobutanoate hydroxymethyltransferase
MGAFKVQGRDDQAAEAMLHDARVLTEAGADLLVLECVPSSLGRRIAEVSRAPVIGIGAGAEVHGQILVLQDILNISPMVTLGRTPRFVKNYMVQGGDIEGAVAAYVREVKSGVYPAPEHCFGDAALPRPQESERIPVRLPASGRSRPRK